MTEIKQNIGTKSVKKQTGRTFFGETTNNISVTTM
jgi:hypothetical protein